MNGLYDCQHKTRVLNIRYLSTAGTSGGLRTIVRNHLLAVHGFHYAVVQTIRGRSSPISSEFSDLANYG